MRYELPFDESLFRLQSKLRYNLIWEKPVKKSKKRLYIGVFIFLLGVFIVYGNNELGFVFVAFGVYFFINSYSFYRHFKNSETEYDRVIEEEIINFKEKKDIQIWEFMEENFSYKDHKCEIKLKWKAFNSFKVIEDNIFLFLDAKNHHSYIISKEEVGEVAFDKLINLLNKKIKGQIPIQDRVKD